MAVEWVLFNIIYVIGSLLFCLSVVLIMLPVGVLVFGCCLGCCRVDAAGNRLLLV